MIVSCGFILLSFYYKHNQAIHGKISTAKVNPKGLAQITYKDGTVSLINKNGAIQCKLVTDVVVSQLPNGKKYLKRADGKVFIFYISFHEVFY